MERIRSAYASYREPGVRRRWDRTNPGNESIHAERSRAVQSLLARHDRLPLVGSVLEVGCGSGGVLAGLTELGARPDQLFGIDLLREEIAEARRRHAGIRFEVANGERLDLASGSFGLVIAFTVFSSILDPAMARNLAGEIMRVLAPGGGILWYDIRFDNPANRHVRGLPRSRIAALFPGFAIDARSITLLPPVARRLAGATRLAYPTLARIPFLRSHTLAWIRRAPVVAVR